MAKERKKVPTPKKKKGLPGGFLLFMFAIVLIIYALQSLGGAKTQKVAFSHQAEYLENLDLIVPSENAKIALNDNLVTFSGRFRDSLTDTAKNRYNFLNLLNERNNYLLDINQLDKKLNLLKEKAFNASKWFVEILGKPISKNGFVVISSIYDSSIYDSSIYDNAEKSNSVVIRNADIKPNSINLAEAIVLSKRIEGNLTNKNIINYQNYIETLFSYVKSSKLGIGTDSLKKDLNNIERKVEGINSLNTNAKKYYALNAILNDLNGIFEALGKSVSGIRLSQLRSIRIYKDNLAKYNSLFLDYEQNQKELEKAEGKVADTVWFFNNKELSTKSLQNQDPEEYKNWFIGAKKEWEAFPSNKGLVFKAPDQERNMVLDRRFKSKEPSPNYISYIFTILPILLIVFVLYFIFSRQMKGGGVGSSAMNFGKSPAKLLTKESNKVTFKDVAGAEEAKEELTEIVDFLKDPQKFTALGARIPKGVLLIGPPGTGKTLVAKAVAGEADRPFFSISGSDFVEMFVGVGASRVRDLFDQGKKNAPCIIFMDEIDAVGRQRGAGIGGGHDEREQTLNQLLVEMDGFDTKEGVILMAATNRPDVLDKALLRPGRFDRRVSLDLPDVKGRFEILKVHAKKIKIDPGVNLMDIAKITPGASGADLENMLNEAALLAARRGRTAVTEMETREACDKVRFGKERRSLEMDEKEKRSTAFHESGHAIVGLIVENADPVDKVTIIPRGFSLGATHFMPKKNKLGYWKKEILDELAIALGGRAAEEIFLNDMSSGAQQDINQATKLARAMVCEWGMTDTLGAISYEEKDNSGYYLGMSNYHDKKYSEETAEKIDSEVYKLVEEAHKRARKIVEENKDKVQLMADMLMKYETLNSDDINAILNGTWDEEKKEKDIETAKALHIKKPPPPPPEIDKDKKVEDSDKIGPQEA